MAEKGGIGSRSVPTDQVPEIKKEIIKVNGSYRWYVAKKYGISEATVDRMRLALAEEVGWLLQFFSVVDDVDIVDELAGEYDVAPSDIVAFNARYADTVEEKRWSVYYENISRSNRHTEKKLVNEMGKILVRLERLERARQEIDDQIKKAEENLMLLNAKLDGTQI